MSNKQINQYTAASGIDGIADYFLIDPGSTGAYNKINRNTALGITSTPLGTSDTQSPTNKIFDNSNAFTIKDGNLTLQSSGGVTKQANFSLSSITSGQTRTITVPDSNTMLPIASQVVTIAGPTAARTYTFPDAATTIVGTSTSQTLTNKTITDSGSVLGGVTMTLGSDASGDVYYRNSSGVLTRVSSVGAQNTVLTMGASSVPQWASSTSQMTLLKANSGTDSSAGANNVDTYAITGLTSKDTLQIYFTVSAVTGLATAPVGIFSVTDATRISDFNQGANIAAGNTDTGMVMIKQPQQSTTVYESIIMDGSATIGSGGTAGAVFLGTHTMVTAWTGSWTIGLRHSGMAGGGTLRWSWSIYKIAGQ